MEGEEMANKVGPRKVPVVSDSVSNDQVNRSKGPVPSPDYNHRGSIKSLIIDICKASIMSTFPDEQNVEVFVEPCKTGFGDYQCNNAFRLWSKIKGKSTEFRDCNSIGQAIAKNIHSRDVIEFTSVATTGFVNIHLSNKWIAESIMNMLQNGIQVWAPALSVKRALVDFSSPNIAKEMHVGHLRSTIIGDTLARMLEYSNVDVIRRNHVGDWGTQFGMLIQYLFEEIPNWKDESEKAIGDLQKLYRESKIKFEADGQFKERAQKAVVQLQKGEPEYRTAWEHICVISRREFEKVYQRLGVYLEEKGESFYNPYIKDVVKELSQKGLVAESQGAQVIFIEGQPNPLIVVKGDGGFNYDSTDLSALWYRIFVEKAEWIIYLTDYRQSQHFDMVFHAAKKAGWLPDTKVASFPKTSHARFGLVLGPDGKPFQTRAANGVRLVDLLDEAVARFRNQLHQRLESNGKMSEWTKEEITQTAEAVGYGAVKYADLKNNRATDYTFSYDQMLNDKGNSAVYLLYAHARICSIIHKSGKDVEDLKKTGFIVLGHPNERALGIHIIRFTENVEEACMNLLPNVLCDYLYKLSEIFTTFYTNCQVVGSAEEMSRLLLCEATAVTMRKCFHLLGIELVYKL